MKYDVRKLACVLCFFAACSAGVSPGEEDGPGGSGSGGEENAGGTNPGSGGRGGTAGRAGGAGGGSAKGGSAGSDAPDEPAGGSGGGLTSSGGMTGGGSSQGGAPPLPGPPPQGKSLFAHHHGFEPKFVEPPGSGMANIKRDFNAVGDGKADDTQAFKKAIEGDDPRTIFIPAGTYLIKSPLRYGEAAMKKKRVLLIGEQRSRTIIRLADKAAGFGNVNEPRVFIHTRASAQQAEQNMHMYIYHLTIEIGKDNPGAIALNFHTNNTGAIKDVAVRAADPVNHPGHVGVAFDDIWFGPGNARYLDIDGFRTGIRIGSAQNHTTLEHISVRHCETGLENTGYGVSIRNLQTFGCKRALKASGGLTVLVDSTFAEGPGGTAVELGEGRALLSDVNTSGYETAIDAKSGKVTGPKIGTWTSSPPTGSWPNTGRGPLNLPVQESPERQYPTDPTRYAVVGGSGDISQALQAAIDGGKETIYITGGNIEKTVELRNKVQKLMGLGVRTLNYKTGTTPVFRLGAGESEAVILELLYENYGSTSGVTVEQAAPRTVVFRHGSGSYRTAAGGKGGRVFIESIVGHPFLFDGVDAWVRDINTEMGGNDRANIVNTASKVWILGQKTEDYATKLATRDGGRTELLGGTYRQNWDAADGVNALIEGNPLFVIDNASASLSYVTWATHDGAPVYKYLVRERQGTETRNWVNTKNGGKGEGNEALYVGLEP
ncbi:MAG: glycoside hydrolase family 55 protein [Myxococcales bacterium]|nr:glycoside hydrolase family 55 protein [Myxococcales bacterium]